MADTSEPALQKKKKKKRNFKRNSMCNLLCNKFNLLYVLCGKVFIVAHGRENYINRHKDT